jgi:hypothetical protein
MNGQQLKKLFAAARDENAPAPSADFAADVLRAVRREKPISAPEAFSIFDQLNLLFPKLALASAAMIALCVATDFGLTAAGVPNLSNGISQITSQWLFTENGF